MHRHGVEKFICKNHSLYGRTHVRNLREPANTSAKFLQRFLLPLLPFCGRFDYDVFDFLEQGRAAEFQPIEYISCEPSIMRARLHDLQSVCSAF
jgi:hypothetical protein